METHHVWLLGSQVSFPTLSMQNFWGPLLPEWVKTRDEFSRYLKTPIFVQWQFLLNDNRLCTYELVEASHRQPTGSCHKLKQADSFFVVHFFNHLQSGGRGWTHVNSQLNNSLHRGHVSPGASTVSVPARTSGSACCSWCNACRWCSSASRPNRSPASHTASTAARQKRHSQFNPTS